MPNLKSNLAGIKSPNPFWLASAPPTNSGYQVMKAFDAGWGGAVWKTLGVPTVNVSSRYGSINNRASRMIGFNNIELITDRPLSVNLKEIEAVKKRFPDHAIVGSLMVQSKAEWHQIIKDVENAGVDGLELNFGCPHGMCERGMGSAVGQEPAIIKTLTGWVMEVAQVPVIVKLTPNVSDITIPALAANDAGANAISLINTIKSLMGVDIDRFVPYPIVDGKSTSGGYCGPAVKPIALKMLTDCVQHPNIKIPVSGIGGVSNWRDAVEYLLLGAKNVQLCTAVMHYGFGIIRDMIAGLEQYMIEKNFDTLDDFIGKAVPNVVAWEQLNLKHKIVANINSTKCIECQLCYTACEDGAHQAIKLPSDGKRVPYVLEENCVGCNLCSLVCPVENCITMEQRDDGTHYSTWSDYVNEDLAPTEFDDERAGGNGHHIPSPNAALDIKKPKHYKAKN